MLILYISALVVYEHSMPKILFLYYVHFECVFELTALLLWEWYELRQNRDSQARTQYKNMRHEPWKKGEIYMMQILEEEIRPDDPRVR